MAKFDLQPKVNFEIKMTLTEEEARALLDLAVYGRQALFLYHTKDIGSNCGDKHSEGLKSLLDDCEVSLGMRLAKIDKAREELK